MPRLAHSLSQIEPIDEVVAFARKWRGRVPMAVATGGTRMVIEKTLQCQPLVHVHRGQYRCHDTPTSVPRHHAWHLRLTATRSLALATLAV